MSSYPTRNMKYNDDEYRTPSFYTRRDIKEPTAITRWGNSQGVRIPKVFLDTLQWSQNEKVFIRSMVEHNCILIEKVKTHKTIDELFANYKGDYTPEEIDFGVSVGKEKW